jgi:osmoprotectant transport system ATP-binding protein
VIKFESVSKTFRDGTAAVVDLSLTAPSGKITVIVGPSGCGKTTTLRMINRMLEPTSGRILWDGTPIRSRRKTTLRRQMGYVIQSGGLFPHRTVLENIGTVPGLLHWSKDKTNERALDLLRSVGLDRKLASRYPAQLSGGQQQRVGVARALAADPQVLLMDEPFSAVDPVVRGELHEFFLGLQLQISKTIVLITHDIDEAIKLGDQVAILRVGGRLAQVGTPLQLLEEPADVFVEGFVGKDRGFRALSFMPASSLELEKVKVVRSVEAADTGEPTLVVDPAARPVGWASAERPGQVFPLGSTFKAESDTLRTALDSALTSLYSLAVAVEEETGRFAGVVSAQQILDQVAGARAAVAESQSLRDEERGERKRSRPDDSVEPSPPSSGRSDGGSTEAAAVAAGDKQDTEAAEPAKPVPTVEDEPKSTGSTALSPEPDDEQPEAEAAADPEEAKIVTVVSGEPVDLRSAEAAGTARDRAGADAEDQEPAGVEPKDAPADREPERDPVR